MVRVAPVRSLHYSFSSLVSCLSYFVKLISELHASFFTLFLCFTMCVKRGKTRSGELDLNAIGAIGSSAAAGGSSSSDGGLTVKTAGGAEATNVFGAADGAAGPSGSCSSC
jgi:hypothetical protein